MVGSNIKVDGKWKTNPEYLKQYYQANKERFFKQNERWRNTHREQFNKRMVDYRKRIRFQIMELLGNKCCRCGFDDWRALEIDHVNGGGNQTRRKGTDAAYYRKILEEIKSGSREYQLLCSNCNKIKMPH